MAMKKSIAAVRHTNSDALIFYAIVLAHGKAAGRPQDCAPRYPAMVKKKPAALAGNADALTNTKSEGFYLLIVFWQIQPCAEAERGTSEFIQYPIISALRFVLVKAALMGRWFVYCAFWINRAIMAATCARSALAFGPTRPSP